MVNPTSFPSNQAALQEKIVNYLKDNKPALYKQKQKSGLLQSYLEMLLRETAKSAQNLIGRGMLENEAWNRAIRQEILRIESD